MPSGRLPTFDHSEARRLHAAGTPIYWIARRMGVSWHAVYRVVSPKRQTWEASRKLMRTRPMESHVD